MDSLTTQRILDTANIVDVVSDFVTLHRRGVNYVGLCPFHDEKTPSFYVSPSKGICKCFSCGKGGNAIHFLMEHEQISFHQAAEWLAKKYGIPFQAREFTDKEKALHRERESLFITNRFAADFFMENLSTERGRAIGMSYLKNRGFRDDIIKKFELGYCPDNGTSTADTALAKGYNRDSLIKTGLCYQKDDGTLRDRFWGRIIFPVHSLSGKIVAFGGRIMKQDAKAAKYVNSPESIIYSKSNELYGLYFAKQAITRKDRCFLVEGYADVISMVQSGIENVVASSGTSLTKGQIRLIHRFTNNITVLYDGDKAGIKASLRGIDMLLEEGMNVKVLLLPDGEDPDSFSHSMGATRFQEYIDKNQVDFIRFKVKLLMEEAADDPISRSNLIKEITQSISVIEDAIVRSVYITECSQILHVDEQLLINDVNKRQREKYSEAIKTTPAKSVVTDMESAQPDTVEQNNNNTDNSGEQPQGNSIEKLKSDIRALKRAGYELIMKKERLIAQYLVRFADKEFCYLEEEEQSLTVGEFISLSLENDNLELQHPVYRRILELYRENCSTPGFISERFFLSHPEEFISLTAASLIEEPYQLSKMFSESSTPAEERLFELTTHIMTDYQFEIVRFEIDKVMKELQNPETANNPETLISAQSRYKTLLAARNELAKKLGDRVVHL
ncbi:MAG: DNA primase [Bacteroidaceae bacterium]|nr:DNA primase [Bacteroidaceae bacterium]